MNSQSPPKGVTVPYTPIKALNVGGGVRLSDIMMPMDERVMLVAITMMAGTMYIRVGPQVEKSSNLHITADSTGSIHKNARGKKFDPKKFV